LIDEVPQSAGVAGTITGGVISLMRRRLAFLVGLVAVILLVPAAVALALPPVVST
jgi:hypothetical protein